MSDVTTAPALRALVKPGSKASGYYRVHPEASGSGYLDIGAQAADVLVIDFLPGWTWVGAEGSAYPAVGVHCTGVELYGGDVSNPHGGKIGTGGGDGVKVAEVSGDPSPRFRWWGLTIHDTAAQGFSVQSLVPVYGDVQADVSRWGLNTALDPHAEKGTGLHGAYVGGGQALDHSRYSFFCHDGATGAAVQCGQYAACTFDTIAATRLTWPTASAGAAFQPWGTHNGTVTVRSLAVDGAQFAIYAGSLSSGAVTVEALSYANVHAKPVVGSSHLRIT